MRALGTALPDAAIEFDPSLVRGMGYYTGTIFEIAHPDLDYSLGGGGRYDGMIGRFLGQEVPACGSRSASSASSTCSQCATRPVRAPSCSCTTPSRPAASSSPLKHELVASGARVRFERRMKNLRGLLDRVTADGFDAFAT